MSFIEHKSSVKSLRSGDKGFTIQDGLISYPRSMLHVLPSCPQHIRELIAWAVNEGHVKCVAHIFEHEETFNLLKEKV
jgi:hypothetical protein